MNSIPLFKSHYSIGRSILTLEKKGDSKENGPDSIVDIASEYGLKNVFLIDDCFSGALEAYTNCKNAELTLTFGVRMTCVPDLNEKNEESLKKEHKLVVLAKSKSAYQKLVKIYTKAAKDGYYYEPRIDFNSLNELWDEELELFIPFYDSYLFKNLLTLSNIVPDFGKINPIYVIENHGLPFEFILTNHIEKLDCNAIKAHSVYYKKREDFLAFLSKRCINKRATLEKPECEHMHSDSFCIEAWKENEETGVF